MKIKDTLIVSDLDGTMLDQEHQIPRRNLEAVWRFMEKGGRFCIATGRSIDSGMVYYRQLKPNAPSVLLNGGMLYDFQTDEVLMGVTLPQTAKEHLRRIMDEFPGCGACLYGQRNVYVLSENRWVTEHLKIENLPCVRKSAEQVTEDWFKVLIIDEAERKDAIQQFTRRMNWPGIRFVSSSEHYLELLPQGIDKGTGLKALLEQENILRENVCAIGDYYNDLELLRASGFAVVPENAPPEVKQAANLVVGRCEEGAVADLIEYLEQNEE